MPHANTLSTLLSIIGLEPTDFLTYFPAKIMLTHLTLDSRKTNQSTVFLAVYGNKMSGHTFLEQAAKNGCKVALVETKQADENGQHNMETFTAQRSLLCIKVYKLREQLANIAYCFYNDQNQKDSIQNFPPIIAITGTNGKTSVASLIAQIASLCNQTSASIGTLGVNVFAKGQQSKIEDTINTTPDIVSLISTLSRLQKQHCKLVTLEASSHGLEQNRLNQLAVSCAVFTNLTQDHLDYHRTMEAYGKAKRKLLDQHGLHAVVLNADDAESLNWFTDKSDEQDVFWYSLHPLNENYMGCWASEVSYNNAGIHFNLHVKLAAYSLTEATSVRLIGAFNLANLLASITALLAQHYVFSDVQAAIAQVSSVSGRMELFKSARASLIVDYAHTPDALKQALVAARIHTKGQLTCVFGCGGDRDKSKRAIMGEVAVQYADNIVLTQDNSRNEDPLKIIADIKKGMGSLSAKQQLHVELDRQLAVLHAWQDSDKNDMILVAGKGHEDYIEINDTRIAYNEREIVASLASRSLARKNASQLKGGAE